MTSKTPPIRSTLQVQSSCSRPSDYFRLDQYTYDLPDNLIAQYPVKVRDEARLLVVDRRNQCLTHDIFKNVGKYLPFKTTLVLNNSKVIPARLFGRKLRSGGEVEVFLLKALDDGYSFEALLRPLKKINEGEVMEFAPGITAVLADKKRRIVRFNKENILEYLKDIGHIPLPPYIKREDVSSDHEDYQTVYAKQAGSVAAPTAGLHFTETLMADLRIAGHCFKELTLHINYGTFKPVETPDIRHHPMHTEWYEVAPDAYQDILKARKAKTRVAAVGTTSCRVLESVARSGRLTDTTNIFIYPGFEFKLTDILITNFHLPQSTLLMLVCAFGGHALVMEAYRQAVQAKYRFFSYGDAMMII